MTYRSYVFGIVATLFVLFVIFDRLRRRQLRERHAVWWVLASLTALLAVLFPAALSWAATFLGVEIPINLVFFVSLAALFFVGVQHASELTKLEAEVQTLAERLALLEMNTQRSTTDSTVEEPDGD